MTGKMREGVSDAIQELAMRNVVVRRALDEYVRGMPYDEAMGRAVIVLAETVEDMQKELTRIAMSAGQPRIYL